MSTGADETQPLPLDETEISGGGPQGTTSESQREVAKESDTASGEAETNDPG
jgi:hypothetical protein